MEQIHGHEVIDMMMSSGKDYSRQDLIDDINAKFGTAVKFYTCSAENMTAGELVDFLEAKGKFVQRKEGFQFNPEKRCSHG